MACDVGDDGDLARFQDSSSRLSAAFPGAAGYFSRFVVNTATYSISTLASPNHFLGSRKGLNRGPRQAGVPGRPDVGRVGWKPDVGLLGWTGSRKKTLRHPKGHSLLEMLVYQLPTTLFFSFQRANSFPRPEAEVF